MNLNVNTINITTSYQYPKNKNLENKNSSFASQLNKSQRKLSLADNNISASVYSSLGVLRNTVNLSKSSTDYSVNEIEKRRAEINELRNFYEVHRQKYGTDGVELHNPDVMEKVLDLQIKNNKDIYYTNGKIDINKIAKDCGISLDNVTPLELESIRKELTDEGLIDEKTSNALETFVSRIDSDTVDKTGCSYFDSYNNIRISALKEALYFKDLDSGSGATSQSREIDNIILEIIK